MLSKISFNKRSPLYSQRIPDRNHHRLKEYFIRILRTFIFKCSSDFYYFRYKHQLSYPPFEAHITLKSIQHNQNNHYYSRWITHSNVLQAKDRCNIVVRLKTSSRPLSSLLFIAIYLVFTVFTVSVL